MVETGHWTVPDLINYLVLVQDTLQPDEIEQLRVNPVFPEEVATEQNQNMDEDGAPKEVSKLKVSDLYEPLDVFRDLGLPIINWGGKDCRYEWRPNSIEGTSETVYPSCLLTPPPTPAEFLFDLGLRRYPPTEVILGTAAKDKPQRTVALDYFLDNYRQKYTDYTAAAYANVAFVPAICGGKKLAKPLEVFSNPDWESFGFPVLDPDLRLGAVDILQIKEHPSTDQLVCHLEKSPPATEDQARKWFGVLSRHVRGLCHAQCDECVC